MERPGEVGVSYIDMSRVRTGSKEGGGGGGRREEDRMSLNCSSGALVLPATSSLEDESLEGGVMEVSCSAHRASGCSPKEGW